MSSSDRKSDPSGPVGFTLLELILVMVIISTVLAMAAPSLRGFFSSRKIHDAAANMLSLIRYARSQAVSEGLTYRLNFDTEAGVYWLTSNREGTFSVLGNEFGRKFLLPDDTAITLEEEDDKKETEKYITFFPQGMTECATITLTDRAGEKIEILSPSPAEAYRIIEAEETKT
jgi:prepilin-type N-terminal cleavage/methylation domain-containing protein